MVRTASRFMMAALIGLTLEWTAPSVDASDADVNELLKEVRQIPVRGAPGTIIPFGPDAFPLVVGQVDERHSLPVVAAARLGKGRIVVFGHSGYLHDPLEGDSKRLVLNAIEWAGAGRTDNKQAPRKVGCYKIGPLLKTLNGSPHQARSFNAKNWFKQLNQHDVVCIDTAFDDDAELLKALTQFVRDGGGLVTAGTGWSWEQGNAGKSLAKDYLGNQLLRQAGLVVTAKGIDGSKGQFTVHNPPPKLASAWVALQQWSGSTTPKKKNPKKAALKGNTNDVAQTDWILLEALRVVPPSDTLFWPTIRERVKGKLVVPAPGWPLAETDALARLAVVVEDAELQHQPVDKVKAHPAASGFPFAVPASAKTVTAKRSIDTAIPDWHSLGLYAAPGATIRVEVPPEALRAKLVVRIGCHTDQLWHLPTWERWPSICREVVITETTTKIASPFGGIVYIAVPYEAKAGTVSVTISGAVEAPYYVLGKTDLADWKNRIRHLPGPWAELECKGVIVTVPSKFVRQLDNPQPVMEFWNRAVALEDELALYKPGERQRPERFVADQQISAGYMHSGYPIMAHSDVYEANVSLSMLRGTAKEPGGWGHWHELGHNHQADDWTPSSTGEVTVNLFSMYVMNKLHGVSLEDSRPDKLSAINRRLIIHEYLASSRTANDWDAFEGLIMYYQLVDAFGWSKLQEVFAGYRKLGEGEHPSDDAAKWDQWLIRYSKAVNKNLGPFFVRWRVPVSKQALDAVKSLPAWMHTDFQGIKK